MISVEMVSGPLKSEYNWGIKNYVNGIAGSMRGVRLSVNESGSMRFFNNHGFGQADVVHLASQTFGHMSKRISKPSVITCHDLMAFSNPGLFDKKSRAILSRIAIKGMERCSRIISVSGFTKEEIVKHINVDADKIEVIHSGINKNFFPRKKKRDADYIVYFGSEERRKNVGALIDAFQMLKKAHPDLKLVKNYRNPLIWKKICSMGLEKDVIVTGNLTEDQMAEYYSNAMAFVYPSLFEGFGFTPLEAMSCGCPVVSSNAAAMPEILSDAAVYFNPGSAFDMAEKISMIIDDKKLSRKLSGRSVSRAKKFSWEEAAKKTKKVYEEAIA